jgi:histidinol-phosphatase (PHP family)
MTPTSLCLHFHKSLIQPSTLQSLPPQTYAASNLGNTRHQVKNMPFSHHSHSGQFCPGHASNTLEEMVQTAVAKRMEVFALTEHMPRHDEDRYPEEMEMGLEYETSHVSHGAFFHEAARLRKKYESHIKIVIGFESEWIRPTSLDLINLSLQSENLDFFVGSVHHVHTKPIDFDQAGYQAAKEIAGGSDQQIFGDYFDAQFAMLQATKPPVVGHFDLIRLKSENPERSFQEWQDVWARITRNLEFIVSYGGLLEINFSSLRKGMKEPYPKDEIAKVGRSR